MSSKQTARKRSASERAPLKRRNEPAPLCSFARTAVTPVPREMGMRTTPNAVSHRRHGPRTTTHASELAA
jgi:hypothetical protein